MRLSQSPLAVSRGCCICSLPFSKLAERRFEVASCLFLTVSASTILVQSKEKISLFKGTRSYCQKSKRGHGCKAGPWQS
jgi:hypothetical protein